ncbi:MAG: ribosomal-processing cysteine protease Prp [Acholeplasmatales bacterium]|nr:ribosomal-processing cysteine protease Prp [Acholeplasmatales bacterium]
MTKYKITKTSDTYKIEAYGHANFADEGEDIVCAGISMAVAMTANLIDKLGFGCNIVSLTHEKGKFLIETDIENDIVVSIMDNLVDHLQALEQQYPKNIKNLK